MHRRSHRPKNPITSILHPPTWQWLWPDSACRLMSDRHPCHVFRTSARLRTSASRVSYFLRDTNNPLSLARRYEYARWLIDWFIHSELFIHLYYLHSSSRVVGSSSLSRMVRVGQRRSEWISKAAKRVCRMAPKHRGFIENPRFLEADITVYRSFPRCALQTTVDVNRYSLYWKFPVKCQVDSNQHGTQCRKISWWCRWR